MAGVRRERGTYQIPLPEIPKNPYGPTRLPPHSRVSSQNSGNHVKITGFDNCPDLISREGLIEREHFTVQLAGSWLQDRTPNPGKRGFPGDLDDNLHLLDRAPAGP